MEELNQQIKELENKLDLVKKENEKITQKIKELKLFLLEKEEELKQNKESIENLLLQQEKKDIIIDDLEKKKKQLIRILRINSIL